MRAIDIRPALEWGEEIIHVMPQGFIDVAENSEAILRRITQTLSKFSPDDYIIPVGHPIIIGWVCIAAARRIGRIPKMLHWVRARHAYDAIEP